MTRSSSLDAPCGTICASAVLRHGEEAGSNGHANGTDAEAGSTHACVASPREASFTAQAQQIMYLAGPLILQNVFGYSLSIVAAISVGHLNDPLTLSAVVLASSFYNVTGYSIIVGLSAGSDTLSGQAYGAGNLSMLGLVMQRAVLICWAVSVPVLVLWSRAGWVLGLMQQDPEIIERATRYLQLVAPTLFVSAVSSNVHRYLLAQRVVKPPSVCTAITALLCPLYNYLLMYRWRLGLDGAAAAFFASNLTYALLLVCYTAWRDSKLKGTPAQTWPGWSWAALAGWGQYLAYGGPAAAMICCEWCVAGHTVLMLPGWGWKPPKHQWVFELVIIFAGSLPTADVAVAVMGLCFHITATAYMVPMGLATATNTLIANALGAGVAVRAVRTFHVGLAMVCCTQVVLASSLYLARYTVVNVFTAAEAVVMLAQATMPVVSLTVVSDGLNSLLSGVLRGCGRQAWGAALNLIGYWAVGFPLAILLGFKLHMTVVGFWTALCVASTLQACIMLGVIFCVIDWRKEVARAAALVAGQEDGSGSAGSQVSNSGGSGEVQGSDAVAAHGAVWHGANREESLGAAAHDAGQHNDAASLHGASHAVHGPQHRQRSRAMVAVGASSRQQGQQGVDISTVMFAGSSPTLRHDFEGTL